MSVTRRSDSSTDGSHTTVTVDGRDKVLVEREAERRNRSYAENPNYDNQADSLGTKPKRRNKIGLYGELAFANYSGLGLDTAEYEWGDPGYDFVAELDGERVTIDVKTADKEPFALFVKEGKVRADLYVLAHVDAPTVTIYGVATQDDILNTPPEETPHDHRNHKVRIGDLDSLPDPGAFDTSRRRDSKRKPRPFLNQ